MKKLIRINIKAVFIAFLGITSIKAQQQIRTVIIQQNNVTSNGVTDTVDFMPLTIDVNGNVTVATTNKINASQYNAETLQQLSNGVNNWINSFSSPTNQKAFITASCMDAHGNTYVTGGVRMSNANGMDMFLNAYKPNGNQLFPTVYYNGPASMNDVGTGICVDNNGKVYITGASEGILVDYATIAFNALTGSQIWATRYDYNYYMDIPTGISYDYKTKQVVVTGSSGSSFTNWDIATVKYKDGSGYQAYDDRTPNTGGGTDKPFAMTTDIDGFVYVTGTKYNASTGNYDMQIQKLDTMLTPVWTNPYDGYNTDDAGTSIALDNLNNVIVTGVSHRANGDKELFVVKYDNAGNQLNRFTGATLNFESQAMRVKIGANNDIFIGGEYGTGNNQNVCVIVLDDNCKLLGEKVFDGPTALKDKFMDLVINSDKIVVSVRSSIGAVDDNLVITYKYKNLVQIPTTDPNTGASHVQNQVLINFDKAALKMAAINNRELKYGVLSDFVSDSTCAKLTFLLGSEDPKFSAANLVTKKIHNLTETDSISIGRLDNEVRVPEFYTNLLVVLPPSINTINAANIIGTVKPDIMRSQLDYLYEMNWIPNDNNYNVNQSSLHSTILYPNAHINCEPAWDRTKGAPFVKAGIYDSGVLQGSNGLEDLVTASGYNYIYNSSIGIEDAYNHGTRVAGVVGCFSNNNIGIAGIAGGDAANPGVSIVNMKISEQTFAPTSVIQNALEQGASGMNILNGKGLHIINCSWGNNYITLDHNLLDAVNYINRNGVALVCSRGNKPAATGNTLSVSSPNVPATMKPNITMNVGASGTDGHYHTANVNGVGYTSMLGYGVDFLAPGADINVTTIWAPNTGAWSSNSTASAMTYSPFGGTSASAPHVTGVTSLMMAYRNQPVSNWDNIVHEDVEAILKRTSTDLQRQSYNELPGWDAPSGYGRINTDSALHALEPQYKIRHIDQYHYQTGMTTSTVLAAANVTLVWPGGNNLAYGAYLVDVIELKTYYNYNFGNEQFIDAWPLYMVSHGYPFTPSNPNVPTDEPGHVEVLSATNTNAITRTFIYQLKKYLPTGAVLSNAYVPSSPNWINSAFTLYTLGSAITGVQSQEPQVQYFNLYPNPNNGNFTVGFNSKTETTGNITITDIMGKTVFEKLQTVRSGVNRYDLTVSNLPKGIYFLSLLVEDNKVMVKKLIID